MIHVVWSYPQWHPKISMWTGSHLPASDWENEHAYMFTHENKQICMLINTWNQTDLHVYTRKQTAVHVYMWKQTYWHVLTWHWYVYMWKKTCICSHMKTNTFTQIFSCSQSCSAEQITVNNSSNNTIIADSGAFEVQLSSSTSCLWLFILHAA